jgi:predicted ATP-dependent endonuclease of OLD family
MLPEVIFLEFAPSFRDSITIDELFSSNPDPVLKSFQNLVKKIGKVNIAIEDWKSANKKSEELEDNKHRIDTILMDASDIITEQLANAWKNDEQKEKIKFKLLFRNGQIELYLNDDTLGIYRPSVRSLGFLWYLRFYVDLIAEMLDVNNNKIILIEEPAIFLHPEAQIDLLERVFLSMIPDSSQVVYTTHSPFMITNDRLNRSVKVCIKREGDKGANIVGVGGGIGTKPIKLLVRKFKYNILDATIDYRPVLIVEGPDDKEILSSLYHKCCNKNIKETLVIVPAGGAGEISKLLRIVCAFTDNVSILVDNDDAGKAAIKACDPKLYKKHYTVHDIQPHSLTIEDLIPLDIYIEAVNKCYLYNVFNNVEYVPITQVEIEDKGVKIINGKKEANKNLNGILEKIAHLFDKKGYICIENYSDNYLKEVINNYASDLIIKKAYKSHISYIKTFVTPFNRHKK